MKKLKKGDTSGEFVTTDYLDNTVALHNYKGQKVLLSFFRGASCSFCNMRLNQLIKQYSKFEKEGIQIITLFAASKEEICKHAGKQKAPFPIIADPTLELYKKFGIEESSSGMIKAMLNPISMIRVMFSGFFSLKSIRDRPIVPADFLIDENQKIYKVYYGNDFGDHLAVEKIITWEE